MDLSLPIGPHAAKPTDKSAQTHISKHSRSLSISYDESLVSTKLPATDRAPASAQLPPSRRTRRVTIFGPRANQDKTGNLPTHQVSQLHTAWSPSVMRSTGRETLYPRQQRPSYPPTSWKGDVNDSSDDENSVPKIVSTRFKQTTAKADRELPNADHDEPSIARSRTAGKLPDRPLELSISSENCYDYSTDSGRALLGRTNSAFKENPSNMLQDPTTRSGPPFSKIGQASPKDLSQSSVRRGPGESTTQQSQPNGQVSEQQLLPEPEIAYSQTFYYTTCPHASPPCSRPLNVQPSLVTYHESLLRYAPFHLRVHSLDPAPEIYTLEGACSQCDLATRREMEIKILGKYKSKVDDLSSRLYGLQGEIRLDSPTLPRECHGGMSQPLPSPNSVTDVTNAVFTPETVEKILSIEADLESLMKKRDREIRFVWRGYTARWGPATLGVFRDHLHPVTRAMQNAATRNAERSLSQLDNSTSDGVSVTSTETTFSTREVGSSFLTDASSLASSSGRNGASKSSSTRTRHTHNTLRRPSVTLDDTPQSRYSNGRRSVPLPPPIDTTKQDGRMQIDWVRREKKEMNCCSSYFATNPFHSEIRSGAFSACTNRSPKAYA